MSKKINLNEILNKNFLEIKDNIITKDTGTPLNNVTEDECKKYALDNNKQFLKLTKKR